RHVSLANGPGARAGTRPVHATAQLVVAKSRDENAMSAISVFPFRQEVATPPNSASDNYQWTKFRVFDLTLEQLERQGLDADTIPASALQDQIAAAITV